MVRTTQQSSIESPAYRLIRALLVVALFSSLYGPYLAIPLTSGTDITIYRACLFVAIPFILIPSWKICTDNNRHYRLISGSLLAFFIYATFSVIWAPQPLRALEYIVFLIDGLLLAFTPVLFNSRKLINWILAGLIVFASANALIAPWEILFNQHLSYAPAKLEVDLINMPYGFFYNPNQLGHALVMIIPFLIFLPLWKKSRAVIIGALFGVLTLTLLIFFTGSRGSLLGLALIIFLAIFINRRRLISQTPILILVIPALAFAIFFFSGNQQAFTSLSSILPERIKLKVDRTINASEQKKADGSIEFRGQMLKQSLKSLLQAPLGQGAGQAEPYLLRNSNNQLESNNPHNPFGEVAINYGFIGLILWSFYFFGLLYALFRKFIIDGDSQIRYLAISCAAALIGFIPASISHGTVWRSFPVMWTIFGLALYTIKTKEPAK